MYKEFLQWVDERKVSLQNKGIATENVVVSDSNPNPSVTVDYFSQICLGRVSVWESGQMDVEILHFNTEKRLLFEHYELEGKPDYNKILRKYFRILSSGICE